MEVQQFRNEIGNDITISVIGNFEETGINHETGTNHIFNAVKVQISGPTSMSENVITYGEAMELHRLLSLFLAGSQRCTH